MPEPSPPRSATTPRSLIVRCPCCQADLTVDAETGGVVEQSERVAPGADLDDLFEAERRGRERAELRFEQERRTLDQSPRLLDEKFERALREARQEPDERPSRPFDLD